MSDITKEIYGDSADEVTVTTEEIENPSLRVRTLEDATRYASSLHHTREEIERINAIADAEVAKWQEKIDKVNKWRDEVVAPLQQKEEYLKSQLTMYHINQFLAARNDKERKKVSSIKLPYGITLKSREQQPKLEVTDETAYKAYAQENDFIKVKEPEVNWSEMKKKLIVNDNGEVVNSETGEVLDFIKVVPQERKFEVK
jgi:hypothetical protein